MSKDLISLHEVFRKQVEAAQNADQERTGPRVSYIPNDIPFSFKILPDNTGKYQRNFSIYALMFPPKEIGQSFSLRRCLVNDQITTINSNLIEKYSEVGFQEVWRFYPRNLVTALIHVKSIGNCDFMNENENVVLVFREADYRDLGNFLGNIETDEFVDLFSLDKVTPTIQMICQSNIRRGQGTSPIKLTIDTVNTVDGTKIEVPDVDLDDTYFPVGGKSITEEELRLYQNFHLRRIAEMRDPKHFNSMEAKYSNPENFSADTSPKSEEQEDLPCAVQEKFASGGFGEDQTFQHVSFGNHPGEDKKPAECLLCPHEAACERKSKQV